MRQVSHFSGQCPAEFERFTKHHVRQPLLEEARQISCDLESRDVGENFANHELVSFLGTVDRAELGKGAEKAVTLLQPVDSCREPLQLRAFDHGSERGTGCDSHLVPVELQGVGQRHQRVEVAVGRLSGEEHPHGGTPELLAQSGNRWRGGAGSVLREDAPIVLQGQLFVKQVFERIEQRSDFRANLVP